MKYSLITISAVLFATFIGWVIYMADTGQNSIFFELVKKTPNGDKIGHLFLFGFLAFLTNFVFRLRGMKFCNIFLPYGSILIFTLGVIEEFSQYFMPNRTLDKNDILADLIGIIIFSVISYSRFLKNTPE
jgi:polysaccharide biosynthesis protein VpsQ